MSSPTPHGPDFAATRIWIFDLDNTLYAPEVALFDQIEVRMNAYLRRELKVDHAAADGLRDLYWRDYGTTLAGLIAEHQIDATHFLDEVHDIDMSALMPDPDLAAAIRALPGRKLIHTNADIRYAARVLDARGLSDEFEAVYGIEESDLIPKPSAEAFDLIWQKAGIDPREAAFFEDDPRNLEIPYQRGVNTVFVAPKPQDRPYIRHHTSDLTAFLQGITKG